MPSCGGVIFGRGARMNIKETTLKYHNRNLYSKLGAANRKELLELRYLCGLTWERVAERMNYCKEQSQRIHKRALEDVQRQMDARGIRA